MYCNICVMYCIVLLFVVSIQSTASHYKSKWILRNSLTFVTYFTLWCRILFTLSGRSIHLVGKVNKYFLDLAGKVYTFPSDEKRIAFLCGKLGKVDKFLIFHIRILYTFTNLYYIVLYCINIIYWTILKFSVLWYTIYHIVIYNIPIYCDS